MTCKIFYSGSHCKQCTSAAISINGKCLEKSQFSNGNCGIDGPNLLCDSCESGYLGESCSECDNGFINI